MEQYRILDTFAPSERRGCILGQRVHFLCCLYVPMKMDSLRGAKSHVVDKSNQLIGADFYCFAILFAGKAVS